MKRETKPENAIRHLLSPNLTREDYAKVSKNLNEIVRTSKDWKTSYKAIKYTLSSELTQETYAKVVKLLNAIVRPYRKDHP